MRGNLIRMTTFIALIPLLLAGCLFGPEPATQEIDPPPDTTAVDSETGTEPEEKDSDEANEAEEDATEDASARSATQEVELYFKGPEGYVVPYSVAIPKVEGIAKAQLDHMIKGGAIEETGVLPEGFTPLIPEGTEILSLNIQDGLANVDLSKEFLNYDAEDEENILSAITWALTAWDSVDRVNIWINGTPLEEMPEGKTPAVDMTRENTAINIEMAQGVQISDSMPVTLYFLGQSGESTYFVPVTRMVPRDEDVAQVAIEELIAGPLQSSELNTEILDNLEVNDITVEDETVLADFGEQLLEYGQENKVSENAIRSIVLSLTENTGADQVKISVEGQSTVASAAEPVTRPAKVNPLGL
mgnify:CR=1 FL=1